MENSSTGIKKDACSESGVDAYCATRLLLEIRVIMDSKAFLMVFSR